MKRLAHPRTAGAILTLVVALSLLLTTVSSAASLSIFAQMGGVFAQNAERCTDATLSVTPSGTPNAQGQYNRVTVSGDFGSCSDGDISLYLANTPHTVLFSAPITVSGGSVEVTTPYFTAPATADGAIILGLDGWLVRATWTFTPPPPVPTTWCRIENRTGGQWKEHPSATCSVTGVTLGSSWGSPVNHRQANVHYSYTGLPSGSNHRLVAQVNLSSYITLGAGQSWSSTTVSGWGVDTSSPLPLAQFNYGNSQNGSGTFSSQITLVS